jgi:hypothetical protein
MFVPGLLGSAQDFLEVDIPGTLRLVSICRGVALGPVRVLCAISVDNTDQVGFCEPANERP